MSVRAPRSCDVAIAGGGMVGLSLAAALGRLPLDVVVIEPVAPEAEAQPSFDSRTTALSNGSRRALEGLGAWEAVARLATPIRRIHVSEQGAFGSALLTAEEQGVAALGHTIENRLLGAALHARVAACPRVRRLPARATGVEAAAGTLRLATDGGETLEARLVVAADGAQSAVRGALGIGARTDDYGQHAVIAHADTTRFHDHTAFERFAPGGPLAVLPIAEGRVGIVWTLAPAAVQDALAMGDADFRAALQAAFGWRLGRFTRVGRRQSYPLALVQAERLTAPRAVILGNAAQSLHPVAGQGFNLALRDVAMLAELLADDAAGDPGAAPLLARYAAWRAPDREAVVRFTDALVRGFGLDFAPLRLARGQGLAAFDLLRPVKHAFARRTMGLAGRQPRLVRGLALEDRDA